MRRSIATLATFVLAASAALVVGSTASADPTPVANDDGYAAMSGETVVVPAPGLLANDHNVGANLPVFQGTAGTASIIIDGDGRLEYTSSSGFMGIDSFTYCLAPDLTSPCVSNAATVTIEVGEATANPVAVDDDYITAPGQMLGVGAPGVLANDPDAPSGNVTKLDGLAPSLGLVLWYGDGSFDYTPNSPTASGIEHFEYCISSAGACVSNRATVTILIQATEPTLVAVDDSYTARPEQLLSVGVPGVLGNDDPAPDGSTAHIPTLVTELGLMLWYADGSFDYTPNAGSVGVESVKYCIADAAQLCLSNVATLRITVEEPRPPGPPTLVSASPGHARATVSFFPPNDTGSSPIDHYDVSCVVPGGGDGDLPLEASGPGSPITVTGLMNGVTYGCSVRAVNELPGLYSGPPVSVTPVAAVPPGAPTGVSADPGDGQATVSFTPPADAGSSPIDHYEVLCTPSGGGDAEGQATGTSSPIVVGGLINSLTYGCAVRAVNEIPGPYSSPSVSVTPVAPVPPGAPTNVAATPGDGQATVSFTGPNDTGSTPIDHYEVLCTPSGGGDAEGQATGTSSPIVVGLVNGVTYGCAVRAVNNVQGPFSSPPVSVTPFAAPGAPTNVSAVAQASGSATVRFTPPANTGTGAITGYEVTCGALSSTTLGPNAPLHITVTGLTNGTPVDCSARARNAFGYGDPSPPVNFIPGVPYGPLSVTGGPGPARGKLTISWNAANGFGAPILGYLIQCRGWSPTLPTGATQVGGSVRTTLIGGLAPGQQYFCSVTARNSRGSGSPQNAQPVSALKPAK